MDNGYVSWCDCSEDYRMSYPESCPACLVNFGIVLDWNMLLNLPIGGELLGLCILRWFIQHAFSELFLFLFSCFYVCICCNVLLRIIHLFVLSVCQIKLKSIKWRGFIFTGTFQASTMLDTATAIHSIRDGMPAKKYAKRIVPDHSMVSGVRVACFNFNRILFSAPFNIFTCTDTRKVNLVLDV